ncbi:PREDICTED: agamous-like MADS-box protein AGL49 [Camelina sativa]|uniref:Agamous-like MADS-box protein AGL49 n=1 Tax=Camelina sativa TaxID=90675 RepID=A0ABM1Q741_CAMSA|nr:PREDICTED: agamous-like MADS-box protein AGL49 [Camelina sativa]
MAPRDKKLNKVGNFVVFICYGPDNDFHVWPEPQDKPQALPEIVGKFNALSDHMRMSHASDLFDLPYLKGLSDEELLRHLAKLNSHLVGIKQKKMTVLKTRGNSKKPSDHLRVSDNAATIISNRKVAPSSDARLGFGESGYVCRGSHETVSSLGSSAAASKAFSVPDSSFTPSHIRAILG